MVTSIFFKAKWVSRSQKKSGKIKKRSQFNYQKSNFREHKTTYSTLGWHPAPSSMWPFRSEAQRAGRDSGDHDTLAHTATPPLFQAWHCLCLVDPVGSQHVCVYLLTMEGNIPLLPLPLPLLFQSLKKSNDTDAISGISWLMHNTGCTHTLCRRCIISVVFHHALICQYYLELLPSTSRKQQAAR